VCIGGAKQGNFSSHLCRACVSVIVLSDAHYEGVVVKSLPGCTLSIQGEVETIQVKLWDGYKLLIGFLLFLGLFVL